MRPERTVHQHLVVQHGTLGFEVGQPHPAILAQRYDPDKLEELLDNIVEMYCCPRQTQYVGKQPQTTKAIRLRLDKLTSQHVEYIFDVMSNTTQPIKNIMAYLRTTILNAPTTMEHYYQAQGNWLTAQSRKK